MVSTLWIVISIKNINTNCNFNYILPKAILADVLSEIIKFMLPNNEPDILPDSTRVDYKTSHFHSDQN